MKSFKLTIVDLKKMHYRGNAQACMIKSLDGSVGLEANHEEYMTILASPSTIRVIDDTGRETKVAITSGMVSFVKNACTIVVEAPIVSPKER